MVVDSRFGAILINVLVCGLILAKTEALYSGITILKSAVAKGAVCLDGSPPAYHLDMGSGTGINSWLVHFEFCSITLVMGLLIILRSATENRRHKQ